MLVRNKCCNTCAYRIGLSQSQEEKAIKEGTNIACHHHDHEVICAGWHARFMGGKVTTPKMELLKFLGMFIMLNERQEKEMDNGRYLCG